MYSIDPRLGNYTVAAQKNRVLSLLCHYKHPNQPLQNNQSKQMCRSQSGCAEEQGEARFPKPSGLYLPLSPETSVQDDDDDDDEE